MTPPVKLTVVPESGVEIPEALESRLRVVSLESPYDVWSEPLARELFVQMISLKLIGYGSCYPYGVLPVDTSDFVSTHHFVCDQTSPGNLKALMAFRTISYRKCEVHRLVFPPLSAFRSSHCPETYEMATRSLIEEAKNSGKDISFGSSWTIEPEVRKNEKLAQTLREIMSAMLVLYYRGNGTEHFMTLGALRFKADQFFLRMGYQPIATGKETLPPFEAFSHFGERALPLFGNRFSKLALELASRYEALWNQRLILAAPEKGALSREAA